MIFLQQLGRGLRAAPGKSSVTVIDFVGNHRMFLERIRTLLSLSERAVPLGSLLGAEATGALELPSGCSVELELEAKEMLSRLFRVSGTDEVERAYRELRLARGERPTAGELQGMGYRPARLRPRYAGWFDFVRAEGDLNEEESRALDSARAFLNQLETFDLRQPLPLVAVQAVVETGSLSAMSLLDNARRSQRIVQRSSELIAELPEDHRSRSENGDDPRWVAFWRDHALTAWTESKQGQRAWFRLDGDRLVPELALSERAAGVVSALVLELLDYRMAEYRARKRQGEVTAESFVCPVLWNKRNPILKLPRQRDRLPQREAEVLVDNAIWLFRFAAQFCNVARPVGTQRNQLPDLLRRWFGPNAGRPGTAFQVRFRAGPDGLWAEPVRAVTTLETRRGVAYYPDLRAAAGHVAKASLEPTELTSERVSLPVASARNDVFAVRVCGTSMDGGSTPLRDGDLVVFSFARDASASALENRVVLVQVTDATLGADFQIKRLKRRDSGWLLASDNPSGPTFEATEAMTPIARLEQSFRPEDLACPRGTVLAEDELAAAFGLENLAPRSGRHEGHLFLFIDRADLLIEPDRIRYVDAPNPGETAFALAQRDRGDYIFLGVARPLDDEQCWAVPDVDYETWRKWGTGRKTSRRLPPGAAGRAQALVNALLELPEERRWIERGNGRRARVLGAAAQGGLRIDGSDDGMQARTVSLIDLAWVIVAADDQREHEGLLDEARVNRLRYLDGTPKASTRWIDTGWALAVWDAAKGLVQQAPALASSVRQVRRDDGSLIDARFRIEPVGDRLTIVFESRGGTRGTRNERNTEYQAGLGLLLQRLQQAQLRITDILLDSQATASLPPEERRLVLEGMTYPFEIVDAEKVGRAISSAQTQIGRRPGARGGGNRTRRIRLFIDEGSSSYSTEALGTLLKGPAEHIPS